MLSELSNKVLNSKYSVGELRDLFDTLMDLQDVVLDKIEETKFSESNVVEFIKLGHIIDGRSEREVYDEYKNWCRKEYKTPKPNYFFNRAVSRLLGLSSNVATIDGITLMVYKKI